MVAPIRYLSRRTQQEKIGILQSTEDEKVLEVIGRVGIGTTIFDADYNLDVRGDVKIQGLFSVGTTSLSAGTKFAVGNIETNFDDITSVRNINASGIITAASFVGDGSNLTGLTADFAKELSQDADGNIFAGDSTTGGGYDPGTGTACFNIFMGCNAGNSITEGDFNFFAGCGAGRQNSTGQNNNFFGCNAGLSNTTGINNNFFGANTGLSNITGFSNNFIGFEAGKCNTTGFGNNFLGNNAGFSNTTGFGNNFIGCSAGFQNTTGFQNNFFGNNAGYANTTGSQNNFIGCSAGSKNTTGCSNNFFGLNAGCNNTTGHNNIAIGCNAGQTTGTPSGLINLTTSGNCIIMGNATHTCAAIQIAWTVISDIRDKCVYGDVPHGRGFLQNINPIKYSFKNRETNEVTDERVRYGFSAQEVAEIEGDETIIASKSNIDKWGVTHEHLLPVLVNAIKELDVENQELKERLSSLEEKVNSLLNN